MVSIDALYPPSYIMAIKLKKKKLRTANMVAFLIVCDVPASMGAGTLSSLSVARAVKQASDCTDLNFKSTKYLL